MSDAELEQAATPAGSDDPPPQVGYKLTPDEVRELLAESAGADDPPPTDEELADAIGREDEHTKRLREQYAALEHAGELLQQAAMAGLKVLPHLLEQVNSDPEESGQRIFDGLMRFFRKR